MSTKYRDFHQFDKEINKEEISSLSAEEKKSDLWVPFLSFPVTQKCNFKCMYCGTGGEATASNDILISLDTIMKIVPIAIRKNIKKFRITGGEPFTHPDIGNILSYFSDLGYFTLVNSNGSLIIKNKELIESLNDNIKFAISCDTLIPEKLENISKVKCHKEVVEGIKFLAETGHLLRLNMVVNKYNYHEIEEMIKFCNELKCDLKLLDVVSVPVPFGERDTFYQEISSLESEWLIKSEQILVHEYTRGFGTPCKRYRFGNTFVTVKNSVKGSHYDRECKDGICSKCTYYPCHEGLYDIFALADGRLCACRWTEKQHSLDSEEQMQYLIDAFKRAEYFNKNSNVNMPARVELQQINDREVNF